MGVVYNYTLKLTIEIVLQFKARRNNLTRDYNTIKIQMKLKIIIELKDMCLPKLQII